MNDKILFVDDDPNILDGYKRQLRKYFQIETALEAKEGIAAIATKGPFAVVVSDLRMPAMDGIQFLSRVHMVSPDSVRIMLTGHADLTVAIDAVNRGNIFRFLTKPCKPDILSKALSDGVKQYQLIVGEREIAKKIKILSITDPLTGCYNRSYMTERLLRELKNSGRYKRPLSLALCDLDHFKQVNDTYGHQAGDEVLKSFVQTISESIRTDLDWLTRYGGEEFIVVLPETPLDGALTVTERLRSAVC